jgi:hypothetical protein
MDDENVRPTEQTDWYCIVMERTNTQGMKEGKQAGELDRPHQYGVPTGDAPGSSSSSTERAGW